MKDVGISILGILIYVVVTIASILPFYAAVKDFMYDKLFWALLDVSTVFIGIIRGAMYFLGYL